MNTLKTRYGPIEVFDGEDDLISRCLGLYGEWAWDEVEFVASTLTSGARVLDVGAFLGTFSLGLDLKCDIGFVCAVEANSDVVRVLERNIRGNCSAKIAVVEALVASANTVPRPGVSSLSNLGDNSFRIGASGERKTKCPVRAMTLTQIRDEHGEFDLVKIDAEGLAIEILSADADHLSDGKTALWVECNDEPESLDLGALLLSWGVEVFYFAFPAHNPENFAGNATVLLPGAYEAGLLVAPRTKPILGPRQRKHRCILEPIRTIDDLKAVMWRTPRWGMAEWAGASAETVIALSAHGFLGETFDTYLAYGWARGESLPSRLNSMQEALAAARFELEDAHAHIAKSESDLRSLRDTEASLREVLERSEIKGQTNKVDLRVAEVLNVQLRSELKKERDCRAAVEAALPASQAHAATLQAELLAEQRAHSVTAAALNVAGNSNAKHLEAWIAERDRRSEVEAALTTAEAQAAIVQAALSAEQKAHAATLDLAEKTNVKQSTAWNTERDRRSEAEAARSASQTEAAIIQAALVAEQKAHAAALNIADAANARQIAAWNTERDRRSEAEVALSASHAQASFVQAALLTEQNAHATALEVAEAASARHAAAWNAERDRRSEAEAALSASQAQAAYVRAALEAGQKAHATALEAAETASARHAAAFDAERDRRSEAEAALSASRAQAVFVRTALEAEQKAHATALDAAETANARQVSAWSAERDCRLEAEQELASAQAHTTIVQADVLASQRAHSAATVALNVVQATSDERLAAWNGERDRRAAADAALAASQAQAAIIEAKLAVEQQAHSSTQAALIVAQATRAEQHAAWKAERDRRSEGERDILLLRSQFKTETASYVLVSAALASTEAADRSSREALKAIRDQNRLLEGSLHALSALTHRLNVELDALRSRQMAEEIRLRRQSTELLEERATSNRYRLALAESSAASLDRLQYLSSLLRTQRTVIAGSCTEADSDTDMRVLTIAWPPRAASLHEPV